MAAPFFLADVVQAVPFYEPEKREGGAVWFAQSPFPLAESPGRDPEILGQDSLARSLALAQCLDGLGMQRRDRGQGPCV